MRRGSTGTPEELRMLLLSKEIGCCQLEGWQCHLCGALLLRTSQELLLITGDFLGRLVFPPSSALLQFGWLPLKKPACVPVLASTPQASHHFFYVLGVQSPCTTCDQEALARQSDIQRSLTLGRVPVMNSDVQVNIIQHC